MRAQQNNRHKVIANVLKFIIISLLLLSYSSPASATTPSNNDHGISKPTKLVLWTPWGNGITAFSNGNLYGDGFHTDSYNQYYAIDFNIQPNDSNMEVYPAAPGRIVFAGNSGNSLGNYVVLRHDIDDGFYYYTLYAHLQTYVNQLRDIGRNEALGTEGGTPNWSPHLHFAVFRCDENAAIPSDLTDNASSCKSVVPEPLIGSKVYEGFGLPDTPYTNIAEINLIGANPGNDNPSGPPTANWGNSTTQSLTTIYPGNKINFSVENLPEDVKEVRFTAYYPNWSNGKLGDWEDNVWRILSRCNTNVQTSYCSWLSVGQNKNLTYEWDPYNDALHFDANWWASGSGIYIKHPNDWVCISFDVFDNAGNVTYAPAGVQCDFGGIGLNTAGKYLSAPAQNTTSSARLIYISQSSTPSESVLPTGSWISPSNGQSFSSSTITLSVNASDNVGGSGVREVRWAAKINGEWHGIGTDNSAPYSINWNWCEDGVPNRTNEDVEIGFEVWDNAGNKWVYSEHGNVNIHIYKNYNCEPQGGINWSANFYDNGITHFWDPNDSGGFMCNRTFNQGNLDKNYGDGSPCDNSVVNNWVGDYIGTGHFDAGNYAFWVSHDDYLKLRIDGLEVYHQTGVHTQWVCPQGTYKYFSTGNHELRAILYEDGGQARVKVEWAKDTTVCDPPGNFNKISPETLSEDASTSRTLSWSPASGTLKYSYCIDTINNNACNGDWQNVEAATSVTLNNLLPNTTYYWQVNAYSVGGVGTPADNGTWWSFTTQDPPPSHNLLMNGSFEEGYDNPTWWDKGGWTIPYSNYTLDSTIAHWGIKSIKISSNTANDAYWSQVVQVQPNSQYRLSGWIKTENVSNTNEINNHGAHLSTLGLWTNSTGFWGTNNWSYVSYLINTGSYNEITVVGRIGTYSGTATGTAWFDDMKLELLSAPTCYSLTKNDNPTGSGNVDVYPLPNCNNGSQYIHGTTVVVNAIPNNGYSFSGWGGDAEGIDSVAYVKMTGNKSISANYISAPPIVSSITRATPSPTSAASANFTATFSESVQNVDVNDFSLTTTGVSGASITGVTPVSDSVYTVSVNTGSGNGTIRLDVPNTATILDTSNTPLTGLPYISGEAYTIQKTTTSTFKSVATYDGWITESSETSNAGGVMNSTNADLLIGDDTSDKQIRAILHFDTSALPDNAVVTAMVLKIKQKSVSGSNPFTSIGALYVDMKNPAFGLPNLELGDFAATAKKVKSAVFNPNPVSGWFSARFNNGGKLYVNRTGTTQLRLYFSVDDNNNNIADFIRFYSGNASAGNRPKLLITYYLP
jgi:hypothetical protein